MNIGHWLHIFFRHHHYGNDYDGKYHDDREHITGRINNYDFSFSVEFCGEEWCDNIKTELTIKEPDKDKFYEITEKCSQELAFVKAKKEAWYKKKREQREAKELIEKNFRSFKPKGIG